MATASRNGNGLRWPGGPPAPGDVVLVTERDEDGAAAVSALAGDRPAAGVVKVAALPGPGSPFDAVRLAYELAQYEVSAVYLALDGDAVGQAWAGHALDWLGEVTVRALRVEFAGRRLAECLAEADEPGEWLAEALADARPAE